MQKDIRKFLIGENQSIFEALDRLNQLLTDLNLFVVNEEDKLLGSITDGDIRRGLLKGIKLEEAVTKVMHSSCKYLNEHEIDLDKVVEYRKKDLKILPIINQQRKIVGLLNFNKVHTLLPIDAVIMAGGKGTRLLPLTQEKPKPMLEVGNKPILAYNLERLQKFGIRNITITVNYLKEQIEEYVDKLPKSGNRITCITETQPLGTIGALSLIENWQNDYILLTNSDLLTNIDYEDFFLEFIKSGADMMVASLPYHIKVPYAILETDHNKIKAFKEKPEYTYYANTGIYLFKKELLSFIPKNSFFNATDLMEGVIENNKMLCYYPMLNYWLDIGKHDDFKKAQEDIKHLRI
ncbi:nucleotidyltransferase family protein [Catalinimonas sp. 4WD22]|uniref:nucleotidyltransferase family protein n=1 Tax=Catalinimonas locisalis TaxID=3133978 RepID=UPI0031017633